LSISNAGTGLLIISSISSDVDWIKIDDSGDKKVLECSDGPFLIKIKIEREKLPAGDHNGIITIQTMQDAKATHQIPVSVRIPKEDSALVVPSTDILDFGSVTLHKEAEFTFAGGSEDSVLPFLSSAESGGFGGTRLVYLQGDFTNWELDRIPMSRVGSVLPFLSHVPPCNGRAAESGGFGGTRDVFFTILPLEDGEYLYQFSVDGREFPDPNNQQMVVIGEHGNCSKLVLNRYNRDFILTNVGTKSLKVKLIPTEGINLTEYEFWLEKGEKKQVNVYITPQKMSLGMNSFRLDIEVKSRQIGSIRIQAKGIAYGPIADVSPQELSLGTVFRGSKIAGSLKIKNVGIGTLIGNIVVDVPWLRPDRFEIPEGVEIETSIPVDAEMLSPGDYKSVITLLTNDHIYGRDKYSIPLSFQLVSMDVEPKEIDFGAMWVDERKEQNVRARRNDGAKIELGPPTGLPTWLDVTLSGRQTLNVKIDWDKMYLESDRDIEAIIRVTDQSSSLSESVTVRGRILIPHIAVDEINFGGGDWKKKTLPLTIRNMGNGKLVLKKIEISEEQKWMSLKYKKRRNAPPEFFVSVNRRLIPKVERSIPITGLIKVHTNDPIEPILDVFVIIGVQP
ncbi:MAG: hypothetical protein QG641_1457, partial [Candidatus Poribacteria bacterium]|nr:hypothetical protein [Candidatus Poribacteria bacterium]